MSARKSPNTRRQASHRLRAKILSRKTVFRGRVFSVTSEHVKEPNGITATREVVRHAGSVVVLAVDDTGPEPRVLLEKQYRYAANAYLWELPAGRIDQGERPLAAGKRELLEETGYRARNWKQALFFYSSPGFLDETMSVFLARGLTSGKARPEEDECIECNLVPLSCALRMISSGEIRDGKTIASILWYAEYRRRERAISF